jgi:hypothetical protein
MTGCCRAIAGLGEIRDVYSYARGLLRGSFAQHGEDTFIQRRFADKKDGFYVDIGASHPSRSMSLNMLQLRDFLHQF